MMVNSGMLLVMRCVSATLLLSISTSYFVYYWLADNVLFLLFKLMRRDFVYFIPMYGAGAWIVAFLQRVIVKNICDYTAYVQPGPARAKQRKDELGRTNDRRHHGREELAGAPTTDANTGGKNWRARQQPPSLALDSLAWCARAKKN
jgi:hypothetical protein